jgi:hypothetical protein
MRRREFITLVGGAAAVWPLAARAQQPMPVIGFLGSQSLDYYADLFRAIRQGLKDSGYVDGEDVPIVSRSAEKEIDRLPALAAELVQRRVTVIVTEAVGAALAAKAATTTIPIVFAVVDDPVRLDLVTSLARPGGNLTGVNFLNAELAAKRLEILRELVPSAIELPCWSTRITPLSGTWMRPPAPWDCKSSLYAPAPAARSMRRSQALRSSGRTPCSTAPIRSFAAVACKWRCSPHAMACRQRLRFVTTSKRVA